MTFSYSCCEYLQIIRYGSNDGQAGTIDNMRELVVADQADSLVGLRYASGRSDIGSEDVIDASTELADLLLLWKLSVQEKKDLSLKRRICHNVKD
jgi:hypothetical protein